MRPSRLAALVVAILALLVTPVAAQEDPAPAIAAPTLAPDSWAAQLDALLRYTEQAREPRRCTERCFALHVLRLRGSLEPGPLQFELEGAVLADRAVDVPLFGPPGKVHVGAVTEDNRPAAVSFDDAGYFVRTASRRFVLRGTLRFQDDLALAIPGPLNTLETSLTGARVVEGAQLSGLHNATIHLDRGADAQPAVGPTMFQLSHAVRVGREIAFTWKLVMRSGADLGVVRLPLRFGERVLDVTGSTGWRVEGTDLLLPTSGREAEVSISGTLPSVVPFTPDPRSEYEWWLVESDAEHRVTVNGTARQMDSAESPIPRTQPSARLFLVQRGQQIIPTVQTLTSVEALAAVVHAHQRTVVLTRQGDLVSDDTLRYENNGIDYLLYDPSARPIFLSTDGTAERIMHRGHAREILVPLRTGSHTARVQSIGAMPLNTIGGWARIDTPSHPLATSRVTMTLGLPPGVIPLVVLGGDEPWLSVGADDVAACVVALLIALVALRDVRRRVLGFVAAVGLWFASHALFVVMVVILTAAGALWLAHRLLDGTARTLAKLALWGTVGLACLFGVAGLFTMSRSTHREMRSAAFDESNIANQEGSGGGNPGRYASRRSAGPLGNVVAQSANEGVLQGVTPVAITLPEYEHAVYPRRELVTRDRPFRVSLLYVTSWAIAPLVGAWLIAVAALAWSFRREIEALRERLRARIALNDPPVVG